jgi:transcriptional regulator with XRE-family HTH domain
MARKKQATGDSESERRSVFELAQRLWKDGSQLRRVRESLGLTKTEFARRAKISVRKLNGYERDGPMAGNFWLFCRDLRSFGIDPRMLDDPDFLDTLLDPDPTDRLKGGDIGRRDKWYGYEGKEYEKFRRWAHRKYIEKMPEGERRRGATKEDVERWYKEWVKAGRPDANEILES